MDGYIAAGDFRHIYDPSEPGEPWYINDHTVIRAADGRWHLFGITHPEPADPFDETEFAHATAEDLHGPWTKHPAVLTVDRERGETHLWAPFVVRADDRYFMFYDAGGTDRTATGMGLATSADLFHWTRHHHSPVFRDGYDARDPMVLRLEDRWVMYYCATSTPAGGNHVVAYRTSRDLLHWSERRIAYTDPTAGTGAGNTESPFVFTHADAWYLLIGPRPDYVGTEIFRSTNPFHFDTSDRVGHVPAHAAEVVTHDGTHWITHAGWAQGGVALAPLRFRDDR
ncbi:glycosyl hydrolase family 32 [Nocardia sp. CDC153]|uniref:glycosyl hydrolase family 32 n=1 Tax=Nocardia sp. CDC153 TaxID=3112167 RepID=UPI002DB9B16D|nr:glycosyl hydrolase family 32 [Nocardia sp. CDC153]MEC3957264.1 glycosyl hydrolase family 32 [Nocardia sp. CDC153]